MGFVKGDLFNLHIIELFLTIDENMFQMTIKCN